MTHALCFASGVAFTAFCLGAGLTAESKFGLFAFAAATLVAATAIQVIKG